MLIRVKTARQNLAIAWFAGSGLTFVTILLVAAFGRGQGPELWDWFLPAITPNLSLIVGVMVHDLKRETPREEKIDAFVYRIALWLSVSYLLLLFFIPLAAPLTEPSLTEDLKNFRVPLAAVQALATMALGAFYVRRDK